MNDWVDAELHVERAHEAYEAGRWDEAETELRQALALNPYQAEWHFNLGLTLEAAGRPGDAAAAFVRAIELDPDQPQAALLAGVNLVRAERAAEAIQWLEQAGSREPESTASYIHRIEAYASLDDHEQAELMFFLGQQVDAEDGELYAAMAESLMDRGLLDRAVWCLREAARLTPDLARVQARLAEAYARTGRMERARQLYLRELRLDPGDTETLLDLGDLLCDMSRFDEAEEKYRRVLELEPDSAEAYASLGELASRRGRISDAIVHYDVVTRLDAQYDGARRRLASLLMQRGLNGDRPRVRELLREDYALWAEDAEAFDDESSRELGLLLLEAGLLDAASAVFTSLAERRPEDHLPVHYLSVVAFERGQLARGMALARTVLARAPRFVPAIHNLAYAHLRARQWLRARYWVRHALEIAPDDVAVRRLRLTLRIRSVLLINLWVLRQFWVVGRTIYGLFGRPRRWRRRSALAG